MPKQIHDQQYGEDRPYDARITHRAQDGVDWVRKNHGSQACVTFRAAGAGPEAYQGHRPHCSVTGWASVLALPWAIQPGLSEIKISTLCRVSSYHDDAGDSSFEAPSVDLRAEFLTDEQHGSSFVEGDQGTDPPDFRWKSFTYKIGEWATEHPPEFDTFSLAIKSKLIGNPGLAQNNTDGAIENDWLVGPYYPWRIKGDGSNTDPLYGQPGPPSPTTADHGPNEATASVPTHYVRSKEFSSGSDTYDQRLEFTRPHDHCYQHQNDGHHVAVWPPSDTLGADGDFDPANDNEYDDRPEPEAVIKWAASYIQIKAIEIREIYE